MDEAKKLALAPQKAEAIILKGPRKQGNITVQIAGITVTTKKALKYLHFLI